MLRLAILALLCVSAVYAVQQEDGVYVLTTPEFDDFVNGEALTVVEFYAPWCGHCKKLTPEYSRAAEKLAKHEPAIKLAKVDCTVETELATRFGVSGYPTLKIFRNGVASEYKGPRETDGIVSYVEKQAAPTIADLKTQADIDKYVGKDAAIIYYGPKTGALYSTFEKLAQKLRETLRFGHAATAGDHKDKIVLIQSRLFSQSPLETKEFVFDKTTEQELTDFVNANILPLVGEVHADNEHLYKLRNLPLVKFYTDVDWEKNSKGLNYIANRIRKAAAEFKDKFTFALAHKSKHQKEIEDAGLKGDSPFGIFDLGKGHKFPAPSAFSPDSLKSFLAEFLEGKHEPYFKSEPIPEQVAGEPVVVVGKTFDSIVNDPTKDVLIEAYAPWCGHCKSLEPKYKELAKKFAKYSDTLTIAKIDATANDVPSNFNVKGFPSIFFVPADKKSNPLTYDSPREVKDFETYIKRNAHFKPWDAKGAKSDNKDEL